MDCYAASIVIPILVFAGALWTARNKSGGERMTIGVLVVIIFGAVQFRGFC
ncbi:MAG: hypothetical protein ACKOGF_03860 [Candidatus Limnocylindrus sp.]